MHTAPLSHPTQIVAPWHRTWAMSPGALKHATVRPRAAPSSMPTAPVGGGVQFHPENAHMCGRHGVQYVAQCVACAALTLVVRQSITNLSLLRTSEGQQLGDQERVIAGREDVLGFLGRALHESKLRASDPPHLQAGRDVPEDHLPNSPGQHSERESSLLTTYWA